MRALLLVVLLPALAFAQAQTPNLHLLLGQQQYENQNWQILDTVVGAFGAPSGIVNVKTVIPGVLVGAVGDGVHDDTAAINAAIAYVCPGAPYVNGPNCGTVYFPAGQYATTGPILFRSENGIFSSQGRGLVLQGAGQGATLLLSATSGTGYSMIRNSDPHTCDSNSGTGSCAAPVSCSTARSTRGVGCPCYRNNDCGNTGTCTGGRVARNVIIRDMGLFIQQDNMVGLDMSFCSTCKVEHVTVDVTTGVTHSNITDVITGDGQEGAGTLGGYDNNFYGNIFASGDVCFRAMKQSNDLRLFGNTFGNTCGSGLVIEGTETVFATHNLFQSTRAATCTGGTTCTGGYHGTGYVPSAAARACTVAADCGEADIIIGGFCSTGALGDAIAFNHIEDSNNPHILLGDGGGTAQSPTILSNVHFGSGQCVKQVLTQTPFVIEPECPGADSGALVTYRTEPLPTCGPTSGPMLVQDLSLTNRNLCFCNQSTGKWCRVDAPTTCNSATAC